MELEKRISAPGTLRALHEGDAKPKLSGYAAVFNTMSEELWGFRELIAPGAFKRTLSENADVRALFNHDANQVLGRSTSGTLTLAEDDKGLAVTMFPPDTASGRDTVTLVERGDVSQMSFGFITKKDAWEYKDDGSAIRTLLDVDLFDVSVVTYPAYTATSVSKRALDDLAGLIFEFEWNARLREQRLDQIRLAITAA